MPTVIDRYCPVGTGRTWLKGWSSWTVSTMGVVTLRKDVEGWGVPAFKVEAARIYTEVGKALAASDHQSLRKHTTPSCYQQLAPSLDARPAGQRHKWESLGCAASVVQVRIGHHQNTPDRRFAQVTCAIDAQLVYTITDKTGAVVGGVGSAAEPYRETDVWWVFERCISQAADTPAWRLKEQIRKPPETAE